MALNHLLVERIHASLHIGYHTGQVLQLRLQFIDLLLLAVDLQMNKGMNESMNEQMNERTMLSRRKKTTFELL